MEAKPENTGYCVNLLRQINSALVSGPCPWMPLFLYTIKNAGQAAVLVVFISSRWPTMANTAFGVASIKKDYLNVSRLLQISWPRRSSRSILARGRPRYPGRASHLDRERLGRHRGRGDADRGTGVGYFVWNEWNNLALNSVIFAILAIGVVGVLLDFGLGRVAKLVAYTD